MNENVRGGSYRYRMYELCTATWKRVRRVRNGSRPRRGGQKGEPTRRTRTRSVAEQRANERETGSKVDDRKSTTPSDSVPKVMVLEPRLRSMLAEPSVGTCHYSLPSPNLGEFERSPIASRLHPSLPLHPSATTLPSFNHNPSTHRLKKTPSRAHRNSNDRRNRSLTCVSESC